MNTIFNNNNINNINNKNNFLNNIQKQRSSLFFMKLDKEVRISTIIKFREIHKYIYNNDLNNLNNYCSKFLKNETNNGHKIFEVFCELERSRGVDKQIIYKFLKNIAKGYGENKHTNIEILHYLLYDCFEKRTIIEPPNDKNNPVNKLKLFFIQELKNNNKYNDVLLFHQSKVLFDHFYNALQNKNENESINKIKKLEEKFGIIKMLSIFFGGNLNNSTLINNINNIITLKIFRFEDFLQLFLRTHTSIIKFIIIKCIDLKNINLNISIKEQLLRKIIEEYKNFINKFKNLQNHKNFINFHKNANIINKVLINIDNKRKNNIIHEKLYNLQKNLSIFFNFAIFYNNKDENIKNKAKELMQNFLKINYNEQEKIVNFSLKLMNALQKRNLKKFIPSKYINVILKFFNDNEMNFNIYKKIIETSLKQSYPHLFNKKSN